MSTTDPLVGRSLGPVSITARLGAGAMGVVYRARHEEHGEVCVKLVAADYQAHDQMLRRFRREAEAARRIESGHVVRGFGLLELDGFQLLVQEYVDGGDLEARVERAGGALSIADALRIAREIALGLAAAHEAGLVHRDLKPGNVLIDARGRAKLCDLGLVLQIDGDPLDGRTVLTAKGQALGTPYYMAPEQWRGAHEVDGRADLYALGVLLHQLLAGRLPFDATGSITDLMRAHVAEAPKPLRNHASDAPEAVERLVADLLAKEPDDRPASARAVVERIEAIAAELGLSAAVVPDDAEAERGRTVAEAGTPAGGPAADGTPPPGGEPAIGAILGDTLELTAVLGRGGMGVVYRARHRLLEADFAVKVIHAAFAHHPDFRARFLREARALVSFVHPGAVSLRELGEHDGGLYMAQDLAPGVTLRAMLERDGALRQADALALARQVLPCLEAAHDAGLVHRDLKPDNLMVERRADGALRVRILDFGIAKVISDAAHAAADGKTATGVSVGTPHYMSPEQAGGDPVDGRSDLYAFAAVLYEALTGRRAVEGDTHQKLMFNVVMTVPPSLARVVGGRVSAGFSDAVMAGLAKSRDDRPASAAALLAALDAAAAAPDPDAPLPEVGDAPVAGGTVAIATGGGGGGGGSGSGDGAKPPPKTGFARLVEIGFGVAVIIGLIIVLAKIRELKKVPDGGETPGGVVSGSAAPPTDETPTEPPPVTIVELAPEPGERVVLADGVIRIAGRLSASGPVSFGYREGLATPLPGMAPPEDPHGDGVPIAWEFLGNTTTDPAGFFDVAFGLPDEAGEVAVFIGRPRTEADATIFVSVELPTPDPTPDPAPDPPDPTPDPTPDPVPDPTPDPADPEKATLIAARQAMTEIRIGKLDEAIGRLDDALAATPDHPVLLHYRGLAWKEKGDVDRALADLTAAAAADPARPEPLVTRASVHVARGDRAAALADLGAAIALETAETGAHTGARLARAALHLEAGDGDAALADWTAAIDRGSPTRVFDPLSKRAKLLAERGDHEGALADYRSLEKLQPDAAVWAFSAWRELTELGRIEPAIDAIERAIVLGWENQILFLGVGSEPLRASPRWRPLAKRIADHHGVWWELHPEQIRVARYLPGSSTRPAFENALGMRFAIIPAAVFHRGSPPSEASRGEDEVRHLVTLADDLWASATEVTNAQFRRFRPDHDSGAYEGVSLDGDDQPVVRVTWDDARAFSRWLGEQEGAPERYRLPTEAELEWIARAGADAAYPWPGGAKADAARFANLTDAVSKTRFGWAWPSAEGDDGHRVSAPVGSYPPNPFGLFDVAGNVWEWCEDRYGPYPTEDVEDPRGPTEGDERVVRGGSWRNAPHLARAAQRGKRAPARRDETIGFRVVATSPPAPR